MAVAHTSEGRRLSALAVVDPPRWSAEIRGALVKHQGNVAKSADELGVSVRQLWRWIAKNPTFLDGTGHQIKHHKAARKAG